MTELEAAIFAAEKGLRPFGNQSDGQSRLCIWSKGWFNPQCPDELPPFLFDNLRYGTLEMGAYRYYHSRHAAYVDLYMAIATAMSIETIAIALSVRQQEDAVLAVAARGRKPVRKKAAAKATPKATRGCNRGQ